MCEASCWSALREQIIDNVVAMGNIRSRAECLVATLKTDAGYMAVVTTADGLSSYLCSDIRLESTNCNDRTQALKSLLEVVEAEAWRAVRQPFY
ncbi:hypothetical protein BDZ91DRAFT_736533 [Kalaharituber pfeilii]|nr:hypothetical protein BDZ91DRAFT_736533 [Kalaharituber pfeilii]